MNTNGYGYPTPPPYGGSLYQPPRQEKKGAFLAIVLGLLYPLIHIAMMFAVQLVFVIIFTVVFMISGTATENTTVNDLVYEYLNARLEMISAVSNIVTVVVVVAIYFFIMRAKKKEGGKTVGWKEYFSLKPVSVSLLLKVALLTFFLYHAVTAFLVGVELLFPSLMEDYIDSSESVDGATNLIWSFIATVVMAPVCEELIYRNRAISVMKEGITPVLAVTVSSVVFGLAHGDFLWICYAAALGFVFGFLYTRSDSIYPSLLSHFIFNLIGYSYSLISSAIEGNSSAEHVYEIVTVVMIILALIGTPLTLIWVFKSLPKKEPEKESAAYGEATVHGSAPQSPYNPYGGSPYNPYGYGGAPQPPYNPYGGSPYNPYGYGGAPQPPYNPNAGGTDPQQPYGQWIYYPGYGWHFQILPPPPTASTDGSEAKSGESTSESTTKKTVEEAVSGPTTERAETTSATAGESGTDPETTESDDGTKDP